VERWPATAFSILTPAGDTLTLDRLLAPGKPVLAIFWSPTCGFCTQIAPEVGEWVRRFSGDVTIAFISDGPPASNLEQIEKYGLVNVGLQASHEVMQALGGTGTPSAVLIQPDGFIQDEPAVGAYEIRRLLGRAISPGARGQGGQSPGSSPVATDVGKNGHTERDEPGVETAPREDAIRAYLEWSATRSGPDVGTDATRLPWATLDGGFVGLDDYLGDDLVLVFWGVDCEFSQRMLIDLKEWELSAGDTLRRVLVISSGDAEANRAQGLRSRIALDNAFSAGGSFGVTGTPAAIRLDRRGRVASELATGADAVLDLLYDFSEARQSAPVR
jgi:thiol-disulfide isomerase/thioredoxin